MFFRKIFLFVILSINFCVAAAEDKLALVISVVRHGDRTPVHALAKYPIAWPQGLGQLSPLGIHQMYQLGCKLRERFVNQFHFLPAHYDKQSVSIRSSDVDRTLMSATSLLYGLYPLGTGPVLSDQKAALPKRFQPIPIHTTARSCDRLFNNIDYKSDEVKKIIADIVRHSPQLMSQMHDQKKFRQKISLLLNQKINDPSELYKIGDNLKIRQLHDKPLPAGITPDIVSEIVKETNLSMYYLMSDKRLGKMIAENLLKKIATQMREATQHAKLKFQLYSGHDTTIQGIFSVLEMPLKQNPPYASEVRFELYLNQAGDYYVDTYYNQKQLNLLHCTLHCPLSQFEKIIT